MTSYTIVGGGISGLYCAYRLLQTDSTCNIKILEKMDRLGGRIMTQSMYGHILEYGPMRFEPDLQKKFASLLEELKIDVKVFSPYTCPIEPPDYNQITFEEISAIERYSNLSPAFALLKHGLSKILKDQWNIDQDHIDDTKRDECKAWLKKNGTFQGRKLHDYGLWDILANVLSKNALDYIQHKGTFYHMLELNPNASDQICFMLDILATANYHLITMKNGSQKLIECLYEKLLSYPEERCKILLNKTVKSIEENEKLKINYTENETMIEKILECDHVIFTCQKKAYYDIDFKFVEKNYKNELKMLLNSVMNVYLYKIFVILENPPFDENTIPTPNYNATRIPCREIHYYYYKNNSTGMIMIYGDLPSLNYWSRMNHKNYISNDDDYMKKHLLHYLQQIFQEKDIQIKNYTMIDWSKEPYKTGVHLWKPGYVSEDIIQKLSVFGLYKNMHICGETFSNYQGFIEGSLRTVDNVLSKLKT